MLLRIHAQPAQPRRSATLVCRPPSGQAVMMRASVALLLCSCFATSLLAHDWPHWRGRSNGVSAVSAAPERWSSTENILWRAEIGGHGISSPVIVGNRVYVTTAISSERRSAWRQACDYLIGCLAILGIPALVRYRCRLRMGKVVGGRFSAYRAVETMDLALFVLLAITVGVFGAVMSMGPAALDVGLSSARDIGVALARSLGRPKTNLWFLNWDEASRHGIWIISSAMALASLALIPFLVSTNSMIRGVGAGVLFAGVGWATVQVPWAAAYGTRFPTGLLIVLYSPAIALGAWHLFGFLVSRIRATGEVAHVTTTDWRLSLAPALLSLAMFVSPNYLSDREMEVTRRLVCLDTASGETLWHADVFTTAPETKSAMNSHATPTPIVAGNVIVAAFGPGIAAFGLDGQLFWSKTFPDWIEGSIYGAGSSPVTDRDVVFVTNDREYHAQRGSQVMAFALDTGHELWRHTPEFAHDGYATPVIYHDGERTLLLTLTSRTIVAYLAASGEMAWRLEIPVGTPIPSLVVERGLLYVTGGRGDDSYTAAYQMRRNAPPAALWSSRRGSADVSSPIVYKGRLFTLSSGGVMVCYDSETGEVLWRQRIGSGLGVFYASLVAADDKVYAVRSNGTTYVVAAEDKFRLVSQASLPDEIYASPAIAAGCLMLRTVSALYCIRHAS